MHYADRGIIPRTISCIFGEITKRSDYQFTVRSRGDGGRSSSMQKEVAKGYLGILWPKDAKAHEQGGC